jgi:benzoyl-CoA 2,3-dioxygenase component A
MEQEAAWLAPLIGEPSTHIFICGLKGMEEGVDAALAAIAGLAGRDWATLKAEMRESGRYRVRPVRPGRESRRDP